MVYLVSFRVNFLNLLTAMQIVSVSCQVVKDKKQTNSRVVIEMSASLVRSVK